MPMSSSFSRIDRLSSATAATGQPADRDRLHDEVIELFDRYRGPLLRYLSSFGIACPDGEEIIQEVFLSLLRHLEQGKPRQNLPGWIFRVAHNLGLKRRGLARRDSGAAAVNGKAAELAIDRELNPEEALIDGQTQERLLSVVQALAEQDRRCLLLRAEGLRYREIAEVLDISLGSVSASLARSLARIARTAERHGQR
jgi:RNA polymerase sigma-70 factor (ECF subfamily)